MKHLPNACFMLSGARLPLYLRDEGALMVKASTLHDEYRVVRFMGGPCFWHWGALRRGVIRVKAGSGRNKEVMT